MSGRVDLPSGAWVALKDPKHVTMRQRRPVLALFSKMTDATGDVGVIDDLTAAAGAALIAQWSFDEPVSVDAFLDLMQQQDTEILQPMLLKAVQSLTPSFNPDDVNDPASPTPAGEMSAEPSPAPVLSLSS